MSAMTKNYTETLKGPEYKKFPFIVNPNTIPKENLTELDGYQRLIMLDRYSQRDSKLETIRKGDVVVAVLKDDPKYPTMGYGKVVRFNKKENFVEIKVDFPADYDVVRKPLEKVSKPLEIYWEQISYRVAKGISKVEKTEELRNYWLERFFWMIGNFLAIPGGRILYGAGSGNDVTLFNCFVLPFIQDSRQGINHHIGKAMEIMSRGGGVGSNISTLRPTDSLVHGVNGKSSGSISWANYLAQLTHLIIQGGSRRGAQMIGMSDWHPDVLEFILSKIQNPKLLDKFVKEIDDPIIKEKAELYLVRDEKGNPVTVKDLNFMTGANISVLISDDFMEAVEKDEMWELKFPDVDNFTPEQKEYYNNHWHEIGDVRKWEEKGLPVKVYHRISAKLMWDFINTAARYSAEPGIIFIDRYNKEANSWYYAPIVVTNPCGEQGLTPNAVCNLIAINMANMLNKDKTGFDYDLLKEVVRVSQRFGDNVIDASFYFLPENEKMAISERRIGKGVMGLADAMIDMKLPYGSEEMLKVTDEVFEFIATESYLESVELAKEKGSFAYFEADKFLESGFMKRMPENVREAIREHGIRNVCSLTVAPTGTTGSLVGVAQGLEPYFSFSYFRTGKLGKFVEVNTEISQRYFDENPEATELPDYFVSAMELSPDGHINVQATIQRWVDSSISKTVNAPEDYTVAQTRELYEKAYKLNCKGTTIYVDKSRDSQVLTLTAEENTVDKDIVEEVGVTSEATPNVNLQDEDLYADTRSCVITYDEQGNMIKECS